MDNSDPHLCEAAEKIAFLRPLSPYPGWRFNIDWDHGTEGFGARRKLWQECKDLGKFLPVVIPWHHGTQVEILLSNDVSQQVFIGGCIEPNEMAFLDRFLQAGMTFIDVGANEGLFALLGGAKVGPGGTVWAFEPSRRELRQLQANVHRNPNLPIEVFPCALANRSGTAALKIAEATHAGQNTLGEFGYKIGAEADEVVSVRKLDDLVTERQLKRLDLIKIDVEGAEAKVVEGAGRTLEKFRPVVLFELMEKALISQKSSVIRLLNQFRALNYRFLGFCAHSGLETPWDPDKMPIPSDNILAWPKERPFSVALG